MEEVVYVAGKRAHEVWLLESLHTDGTLRSTRPLGDAHLINLHRALIAAILTPIAGIALHKSILHVSVHLTAILSED